MADEQGITNSQTYKNLNKSLLAFLILLLLPACSLQQVSYKQDVHPILENNCNACHTAPYGYGYQKSGLKMDSYHALMKGTIYGPVIIAGDSRRSIFNKLVEGRAGQLQKTLHQANKINISEKEIETLKVWVNQGALNN